MDKNKTVEEEAAYFHPVLKFVSRSLQSHSEIWSFPREESLVIRDQCQYPSIR